MFNKQQSSEPKQFPGEKHSTQILQIKNFDMQTAIRIMGNISLLVALQRHIWEIVSRLKPSSFLRRCDSIPLFHGD